MGLDISLLKNWWWLTLNGIAAIIFGLVAIIFPPQSMILLLAYFGLLALFLGAFFMLGGYLNRHKCRLWDFWFFEGVLNSSIGLILLFNSQVTIPVFMVLLSLWAFLLGAIQVITVLRMWDQFQNRFLYLVNGFVAAVFGSTILLNPFQGIIGLIICIGVYTVILGIFSILISQNMMKIQSPDYKNETQIYTYHHQ